MKQVALNVNANVVLNEILMSQSVFLLFLRYISSSIITPMLLPVQHGNSIVSNKNSAFS